MNILEYLFLEFMEYLLIKHYQKYFAFFKMIFFNTKLKFLAEQIFVQIYNFVIGEYDWRRDNMIKYFRI